MIFLAPYDNSLACFCVTVEFFKGLPYEILSSSMTVVIYAKKNLNI